LYSRTATDDNMAYAHYMLSTEGYRYTIRICNIYCFSAAKIVETTAPRCCDIRTLPVLFIACAISRAHIFYVTECTSCIFRCFWLLFDSCL